MGDNSEKRISPIWLLLRFLKIGTVGFGGGAALIPVIEKELCPENGERAMSEEDYLKHTVISSITPGTQPVKLGATCGYAISGPLGSMLAAYGALLPGVLLTLILMSLLSMLGKGVLTYISYAAVGVLLFICLLMLAYTVKVCKNDPRRSVALTAVAFILTSGGEISRLVELISGVELGLPLFDIATIDLMLLAFLAIIFITLAPSRAELAVFAILLCFYSLGSGDRLSGIYLIKYISLAICIFMIALRLMIYIKTHRARGKKKRLAIPRGIVCTMLLLIAMPLALLIPSLILFGGRALGFAGNVAVSTVTSFGGGAAYISVAEGIFVDGGYVSSEQFWVELVPIANALPGATLVKIAAGSGYIFGSMCGIGGAWLGASLSVSVVVAVCNIIALCVLVAYDAVRDSAFIKSLSRYILPVICGMLLSTSLSMLGEAAETASGVGISALVSLPVMLLAVALMYLLSKKLRVPDIVLLLSSAAASFALLFTINYFGV